MPTELCCHIDAFRIKDISRIICVEIRVEADEATELNRREKGKFYVGEHSIFIHATVHGICRF
jgi:hypothetical protein